jgi:tRNA modification GTPase
LEDTIIAIATPPGNGAIGIIRLSGPQCLEIANKHLNKKVLNKHKNMAVFRKIIEHNKTIEHCIITYFRAPNSYTGEDIVEISTHGNVILMGKIVELFLENKNLRIADPGEFTQRAFMNGKMDLTQAESVADLIESTSLNAAKISIGHIEGDVKTYLKNIKEELIQTRSLLELELDFSQEDLELVERKKILNSLNKVKDKIDKTIEIYESKKYLREGIKVAIIGKPNAGKSSLLNAIVGRERAIVSHIPGTTRDYLDETMNFKGVNIKFIDTAGVHHSEDDIEMKGIKFSFEKAKKSDLTIVVLDNSHPIDEKDKNIFKRISKEEIDKILVVLNKSDIGHEIVNDEIVNLLGSNISEKAIEISAKNKENIDHIKEEIFTFFEKEFNDAESEIVISNERQYRILKETRENIDLALENFKNNIPTEMTAFDIREIVNSLGSITGEVTPDDILNNIFRSFCIGK